MKPDFDKGQGLLPAIVQDAQTQKVLMLGYMNVEAFNKTLKERKVTFFSRSKERLWTKGETSKNYLFVKDVLLDCDQDTILIKAIPAGPVCHTGADTCFNEKNNDRLYFLENLQNIINQRKASPKAGSYTSELLGQGINKIAQKVGEEAVELIIEAKDSNNKRFKDEAADLIYHLLVLLKAKDCELNDVVEVLQERHK